MQFKPVLSKVNCTVCGLGWRKEKGHFRPEGNCMHKELEAG